MVKNNKRANQPKKPGKNVPNFTEQVRTALFENDNTPYRDIVDQIMDNTGETAAEIAAALVGMLLGKNPQMPLEKAKPKAAPAAKETPVQKPKKAEKAKAQATGKRAAKPAKGGDGTVKLSISGGKNKSFTHKDILGALAAHAGIRGGDMKDIQIAEKATFLSVSEQNAAKIMSSMNSPEGKIKGIPVKVQVYKERRQKPSKEKKG